MGKSFHMRDSWKVGVGAGSSEKTQESWRHCFSQIQGILSFLAFYIATSVSLTPTLRKPNLSIVNNLSLIVQYIHVHAKKIK